MFDDSSIFDTEPPGSWVAQSRCVGVSIDVFFPKAGSRPTEALLICGRCVVRVACAEYALENNQHWGVWGGLTERQRFAVKKARREDDLHPLDPQRSVATIVLFDDDPDNGDDVGENE